MYTSPAPIHVNLQHESSTAASRVFLLFSLLSSLLAWIALYLPWTTDGTINGTGTPVGAFPLASAATMWSFAALLLLGFNLISSLLWLWQKTRFASLLFWGVKVFLNIGIIFLVTLYLVQVHTAVGPWMFACDLVASLLCDVLARRRYHFPEMLITPMGEETLRPPY